MKYAQLKELSTEDLQKKVVETRKELIKLNGSVATGTNQENPGLIRQTKKTIARLLTEINARGK